MKARLLAAAMGAAAFIGGGSAFAADLGGNCCADLEERIAELEATTARKGNRKVSLTITGWVSSQIYWFDDSIESNTYVLDTNNDLSSNVKFTGSAQIAPGWKAGYSLWLYTNPISTLTANNNTTSRGTASISVENSYWFIQSDQLGKVSVGHQSLAADNLALGADFSGTLFPANGVTFDGGLLGLVQKGTGRYATVDGTAGTAVVPWINSAWWCEHAGIGIANDCAGGRLSGIRYDAPTIAGFSFSASWGEDDYWDVAARYSGEFSGFKVALNGGYSVSTDHDILATGANTNDNQYFQVGGMIKHLQSGLWFFGTYGLNMIDDTPNHPPHSDITGVYLKGGLSQKYFSIGQTHLYGEYGFNDDAFASGTTVNGVAFTDSDARRWGVGVVQEVDAAAMSLWAKWRHHELEANGGALQFESIDMFLAGAVIFY